MRIDWTSQAGTRPPRQNLCQTVYNRGKVDVIAHIIRHSGPQSRLLIFGSLDCGKPAFWSAGFPQQSILIESDLLIHINQSINRDRALAAIRMDGIDGFDVKEELTNGNSGLKAGTEINPSYVLQSRVLPRETAEPKVPLSQQVQNFNSKIPLVRGNP